MFARRAAARTSPTSTATSRCRRGKRDSRVPPTTPHARYSRSDQQLRHRPSRRQQPRGRAGDQQMTGLCELRTPDPDAPRPNPPRNLTLPNPPRGAARLVRLAQTIRHDEAPSPALMRAARRGPTARRGARGERQHRGRQPLVVRGPSRAPWQDLHSSRTCSSSRPA